MASPSARALDYERLFEALPSPYLIMTADFTIVTINQAYADATMIDREAVAGRPMFEVFPDNPDDPDADGVRNLRRSLQTVVDSGRPDALALQRYDIRTPEGGFVERYWSPVNTPVFADDGSVAFIVHRVQDVTDLVELRRRGHEQRRVAVALQTRVEQMEADLFTRGRHLQDANRELQRVNAELAAASDALRAQQQAKDRFIATLSHELRNPLASARAALDVLGLDVPDHPARAVLARQLTALTRMTDDLLEAARVVTGQLQVARRPLDLRTLVAATVRDIEAALPGTAGIHLALPDMPATVHGDPVRLAQMISNLLDNARKHAPTDLPVHVEVTTDAGHAFLRVRDPVSRLMRRPACSTRSCGPAHPARLLPPGWAWAWPWSAASPRCTTVPPPPTATVPALAPRSPFGCRSPTRRRTAPSGAPRRPPPGRRCGSCSSRTTLTSPPCTPCCYASAATPSPSPPTAPTPSPPPATRSI
nr:PAS domain-containing sensor histidine kinase [Nonomuraea sp. PA05]